MERDHQTPNQNPPPSLLSPNQNPNTSSPRNVSDRLKRDEWSEGAVSSLLEAYEAKWTLRNRAKLKGQDWEEVAKHVSARAGASKSAKTLTQCKNKIESMKKRYRSESAAAADASSWPLYPRLDLLLRGNNGVAADPPPAAEFPSAQNSNGADRDREEEGGGNNEESEKKAIDERESSTAAIDEGKLKRKEKWRKREREGSWEIGESIRWVAEVVVRAEESRMETMREIERMRAEAEAKRGELELKRTEIIANTQLQIAKLFARGSTSIQ
ncbi:trihelix transcription factor ASIL1-like isoform X2 [Salvia splendens]|uniref:trihelix transcription factor ASIL1-like isoform X2 n=1 Tax=Salvia splendens TaxID=180675 RepID=UPI001C25989E|nr:trihelix transcription factor ASIL1-like isoform X2 [Salvia splendens]